MKTQCIRKESSIGSRRGAAMMIVMILAGLMLMATFSLVMMAGSMARKSQKIYRGVQALSIAEAGVADVVEKMGTNYAAWADAVHTSDFAGGSYVVSTRTDLVTGNVTVWSDATIAGNQRETVVELLGDIFSMYDRSLGAGDALLAKGDITLETAALRINGAAHANGNVLHTRGNTEVNGDVSAVGVVEVNVTGGHTTQPGAAPIVVPDYQPFDAWKALAISGGIYYPGSVKLAGQNLVPANGIVYVDGDIEVVNQSSLVGTLVASGSITINNRFDQTPFNTNWPCLLAGMNVGLYNRNSYSGVIFAGNDIISRNNRYIRGALVAMNNIYMEDGTTLDPLPRSPDWTPYSTNTTPPEVIVGGWLR